MTPYISAQGLADELKQRGHMAAATVLPMPASRPWFISLVLGFAGWLAGAFVLAFVYLLFKPDTPTALSLAGLVLLVSAFGLYAVDRSSQFFDQLALALSIAGQLALAVAAMEATDSAAKAAALIALLQLALLFLMPNDLAKVLAAFFSCCACVLALRFAWWGESQFDGGPQAAALGPALAGWAIIWVPVIAAVHIFVAKEAAWLARSLRRIARPALTGLLLSLCVATWLSEPLVMLDVWRSGGQAPNWLVLWPLLGAAAALVGAIYAFRLRNLALIGVAIAGALLHLGQFYYLLGATLLMKASIMMGVGIAALIAANALREKSP